MLQVGRGLSLTDTRIRRAAKGGLTQDVTATYRGDASSRRSSLCFFALRVTGVGSRGERSRGLDPMSLQK
jgi:hypothetical protein